jgi:hypothetical protein
MNTVSLGRKSAAVDEYRTHRSCISSVVGEYHPTW